MNMHGQKVRAVVMLAAALTVVTAVLAFGLPGQGNGPELAVPANLVEVDGPAVNVEETPEVGPSAGSAAPSTTSATVSTPEPAAPDLSAGTTSAPLAAPSTSTIPNPDPQPAGQSPPTPDPAPAAPVNVVTTPQPIPVSAAPVGGPDLSDVVVPTAADVPAEPVAPRPQPGSGLQLQRAAVATDDDDGTNADPAEAHVPAGPFEITVSVDSTLGIRGFETALSFDGSTLEFGGVRVDDASTDVIVAEVSPGLVSVAAFTCQSDTCVGGPKSAPTLPVIVLRFVPTGEAGSLDVSLGSVQFVDANGLVVGQSNGIVMGSGSTADAGGQVVLTPEQSTGTSNPSQPQDLTADGRITRADLTETTIAWRDVRVAGNQCDLGGDARLQGADNNGDGCIDIADVQAIASSQALVSSGAPLALVASAAEVVALNASGPTFVVDSTSDLPDFSLGDGICNTFDGDCSLRAAILESNAMAGPNQIAFNIAGSGLHTIDINGQLPTISDETGGVTIDGYTQPGATVNTDPLQSNADIRIEIKGPGGTDSAFIVTSGHNVIRGLSIYDGTPIEMNDDFAAQNAIIGNFIGTNVAMTWDLARQWGNSKVGVLAINGARYNFIGAADPADRNVISGNGSWGIRIDGGGSDGNIVQNNIIGLNAGGTNDLPNNGGIDIQWSASYNVVGGVNQGEHNVFSGSSYTGVDLSHNSTENYIVGNYMGTDLSGTQAFSYTDNRYGVIIKDDPIDNFIIGNILSNSREHGLWHKHNYTGHNTYIRNWIGLGIDGSLLGNVEWGIELRGHDDVVLENVIADNGSGGIYVRSDNGSGASGNEVSRNNRFTRNVFFGNGGLAIDLEPQGRNLNDPGDADNGVNDRLNYPELSGETGGTLTGTACAGCTIEVYIADPTSSLAEPEGQFFVGEATADGAGDFSFTSAEFTTGRVITTITIDATGNTSEFSPGVAVAGSGTGVAPTSLEGSFFFTTIDNTQVATTTDVGVWNQDGADATTSAVIFDLTVPTTGDYELQGLVSAPNGTADSFWVAVDGDPGDGFLWDVEPGASLHTDWLNDRNSNDPVVLTLTAGTHTVRVALREDGTGIATLEAIPVGSSVSVPGPDPFPNPSTLPVPDLVPGTPAGRLEVFETTVADVWVPVTFAGTFIDPVAACSVRYENNTAPVVVRMQNVTGTGLELLLQNPGDLEIPVADTVDCIVADAGVWTLPDGTNFEAVKVNVTSPDYVNNWVATSVALGQAYTTPVVLGQVMSYNDTRWSTFWDRGSSQTSPPNSNNLKVGYEVAEDPDQTRLAETLGVIVFDSTHSTVGGVEFETGRSADIAIGVPDVVTQTFATPFAVAPTIGVVAQTAMDGGNGGWAYTPGATPLSTTGIDLQIDEDQIADAERLHTTEQVAYAAFGGPLAITFGGTPSFQPTLLVYDDFSRELPEVWGVAPLGGAWATLLNDPSANQHFSVVDGKGRVSVDTGDNHEAVLVTSQLHDFDLTLNYRVDVLPDKNTDVNVHGRWANNRNFYRGRARFKADGTVQAQIIRVVNNVYTTLATATVPGLSVAADTDYTLRVRMAGSGPTTIEVKLWQTGTAEPSAWAVTAVDSDVKLQGEGAVGTRFQIGGGSANPTTIFSVDDFMVIDLPA